MVRKYIYILSPISTLDACIFVLTQRKVLVDVCRRSFPVKFEGFGVEGRSCHVMLPW